MSYQPGSYQQAPYQQAPYPQGGYTVARRGSGGGLVALGVILVLVGIVAGGALYVSGKQQYSSKVKNLVAESAALSGCVTDLTIGKAGTYTLYYVSKGSVRINGANDACSSADVVPIAADPSAPQVSMKLTNSLGKSMKMSTPSFSTVLRSSGVVAEPYKQVTITVAGDYQLEIASPDTGLPFAIGVGPKITKVSSLLALVVGLLGTVFGIGCALLGAAQGGSASRRGQYGAAYPQYGGQYQQQAAQYPAQPVAPYQPPVQRQAPPVPRQAPPVQRPAQGPPPVQRPAQGPPPVQRPAQGPPPVQRPAEGPAPTVRQPEEAPPTQRNPQGPPPVVRPPQQPGQGLPQIVSSDDESGSLSSSPPTRRMPDSVWEPEPPVPPTRPVSSQRPVPPLDPDEDLD